MIRKVLMGLLVILLLIQFIPIRRDTPDPVPGIDFIEMTNPPEGIALTLKNACYDCHSYQTVYPWYAHIAPMSFWINNHVDHGREHLNFTEWGTYDSERIAHKLDELIEEVKEENMPLDSYTWIHREARLTLQERSALIDFIENLRTHR